MEQQVPPPRNHYVYPVSSNKTAPVCGGQMLTWFMYYKWPTGPGTDDDERQVPVLGPETFSFKRGDILWFTVDGMLLGCVEVDRVEWLGPMHVEVWYRASKAVTYCASKRLVKDGVRKIPSKQGERWLEELKSPAR